MAHGYQRLYDQEEQRERVLHVSWRRLHQCHAKLATTSQMATLMSFFSLISVVELKLVAGETSDALIASLSIVTSLLVAATILVKTAACSLIPYLESVVNVSLVQDVSRSPHEVMIQVINVTWLLATVFLPTLFVIDLIIMVWIKFSFFTIEAAYAATIILVPLLIIILGFGIVFYKQTLRVNLACVQLSKSKQASISLSLSSTGDNYDEPLALLQNPFMYTSYGSTLPTDLVTLCGFLD